MNNAFVSFRGAHMKPFKHLIFLFGIDEFATYEYSYNYVGSLLFTEIRCREVVVSCFCRVQKQSSPWMEFRTSCQSFRRLTCSFWWKDKRLSKNKHIHNFVFIYMINAITNILSAEPFNINIDIIIPYKGENGPCPCREHTKASYTLESQILMDFFLYVFMISVSLMLRTWPHLRESLPVS